MQIPIKNIYYLLCYAWNKLEERDRVNVSLEDTTQLSDLFAKVLINATQILLKRGIDRSYANCIDEVSGIKGKLQLGQTLKSNLLSRHRTICEFDDLSANTLLNQILVTSIQRLINTKNLNNQLRIELSKLRKMLPGIKEIRLVPSIFNQITLNRNNRFYRFVANVCQLIHESILPSEEVGAYYFSDFTRDDQKMNRLFEEFVRNFYRIEQRIYPRVGREIIKWQFDNSVMTAFHYMPEMETDITLENDHEKIIIDAKFYRETMVVNYGKERVRSTNLYQLFSYLLNQRDGTLKCQCTTGILLYPTIEKDYDLDFQYQSHKILIRTVDLNANCEEIDKRLKQIIGIYN